MGIHIKALIVTTLIMEISSLFALTAIWAVFTELHASGLLVNGALMAGVAGMLFVAVLVYRRALLSERRISAMASHEPAEEAASETYDTPGLPNQIGGSVTARPANPAGSAAARYIHTPH